MVKLVLQAALEGTISLLSCDVPLGTLRRPSLVTVGHGLCAAGPQAARLGGIQQGSLEMSPQPLGGGRNFHILL